MSRKLFSSGSPRRRDTFRPQLEVLEDRLPPGGLNGGPDHSGDDRGDEMAEHRRDNDDRDRTIRTTSGLVDFDTQTIVLPGSTTLTRTAEEVSIRLHATDLRPGAYTFWMVEIQPNGFAHGGRVAGMVVGHSGIANVQVEAEVGQILGDFHPAGIPPLQAAPLSDPLHSEFRLVIRYHGAASSDPVRLQQQLHTFEDGVPGVTDYAVSIHVPPR
jgi:hypothetical protein